MTRALFVGRIEKTGSNEGARQKVVAERCEKGLSQHAILYISALLVCLSSYVVLLGSRRILKLIGESGQKVFIRIMGLILMMIAVEYFFKGLHPYIQKLMTPI